MNVYCVFHRFKFAIPKQDGTIEELEYDMLECLKLSQARARQYIKEQPPKIRPKLRVEVWNAE